VLLATPGVQSTFVSAGGYSYLSTAGSFDFIRGAGSVYAYAANANDLANHYDGGGWSAYVAAADRYSLMTGMDNGQSFLNEAVGFRFNQAVARHTAQGSAYFYDSPQNDVFSGTTDYSILYSDDAAGNLAWYDSAQGFGQVYATSSAGGIDYAYVYDANVNHTTGFRRLV
jgi:hypothetical protein